MDERIYTECLAGGVSERDALFFATDGVRETAHPTGGYDRVVIGSRRQIEFTRCARLHREDGPAVIYPSGEVVFVLDSAPVALGSFLRARGVIETVSAELVGVSIDVASGRFPYRPLLDALSQGAPLEWALSYARGVRTSS